VPAIGALVTSHDYQQSSTVYIVTVTHDVGTDLIVPLQAANRFSWAMKDGGSVASPGTVIAATSRVYVGPPKVAVTLASAPTHASSSLLLLCPYGGMNIGKSNGATAIGRGLPGSTNVVTDKASTQMLPTGWDITSQLGPSGTRTCRWRRQPIGFR